MTPRSPRNIRHADLTAVVIAAVLLAAARGASAQCPYPCWSEVTKGHFTFHYNSPSSVSEPSFPGIDFYLPMPPETTRSDSPPAGCPANNPDGGPQTLPACLSYGDLVDSHYAYDFATSSYGTSPIPSYCPVDAPPQIYYATDSGSLGGPYTGWKGIAFRGSFSGVIGSTADSGHNFLTQAIFYYDNPCFEIGREFGFYRRLQLPHGADGAMPQEDTLYFYYALNSNCGGFQPGSGPGQGQASCVHHGAVAPFQPADSDSPDVQTFPLAIPTKPNSFGGDDWIYEAWVVHDPSHTQTCGLVTTNYAWQIQILDPQYFTPAPDTSVQTWPISDCAFLAAAADLTPEGAGLPGYVAIVHQILLLTDNWGIAAGSPAPLVKTYDIWAAK